MKILAASTVALLVLAAAPFAVASASAETVSISVSKAKLDLNNPRDAQRMMKRINIAAQEVCGASAYSLTEVKRAVAASPCHRDAVAGAVAQLATSHASLTVTGARDRDR